MGLTFRVGNPSEILFAEYAEGVRSCLVQAFGSAIVFDSPEDVYESDDCGWGGWARLQQAAIDAVGEDQIPHLLSMEAWLGGFVPVETEPTEFYIGTSSTPFRVGSLPALIAELELVADAMGLPTENAGLDQLVEEHDDDEPEADEMDYQTYAELLQAVYIARSRQQVLWVVK